MNTELAREFEEDKKGILDIRIRSKDGEQIDVEIQVKPTTYMTERTLFYWSKMYTNQISKGDDYEVLKKCVTINIVDFNVTESDRVHTSYHLVEDYEGNQLTDILEIHYLELKKLINIKENDEEKTLNDWMKFINCNSKEEMKILAKQNSDIEKAYNKLEKISNDEEARIIYEAREAYIRDEISQIKGARKEGKIEGRKERDLELITRFINLGKDDDEICNLLSIEKEVVAKARNSS